MKSIVPLFYLVLLIVPIYLCDEIGWNVPQNKPGGSNPAYPQNPGFNPQPSASNPQIPGFKPQPSAPNPQIPGFKPPTPNPQTTKPQATKDTDSGSSGMKKKLLGAGLLFLGGWAVKNIMSDKNKDETKVCEGIHIYAPDSNSQGFLCPDNPQDMTRSECCYENGKGYCCANNKGKIFGGSFSTVLILAFIALVIFCICRRKQKQAGATNFEAENLAQDNNPIQPNPNVHPNQPYPNLPNQPFPNQPYPNLSNPEYA